MFLLLDKQQSRDLAADERGGGAFGMVVWVAATFFLPIIAMALEISYGDGRAAECIRTEDGLSQCSGSNRLLINCLGDRIKSIMFYVNDGDGAKKHDSKSDDLFLYRLEKEALTTMLDWTEQVSKSNWPFLLQHSVPNPIDYNDLREDDIVAVEARTFRPIGVLIETYPSRPVDGNPTHSGYNDLSEANPREFPTMHLSWTLLAVSTTSLFLLVTIGAFRRVNLYNRAKRAALELTVV